VRADGDRIAGLQAFALQRGRNAIHQRVELGVSEAGLAAQQGRLVGACSGVVANHSVITPNGGSGWSGVSIMESFDV
jgi:hypothetical protein